MIHYHGTPITPRSELLLLAGRNFCISFAHPRDLDVCLKLGQALMYDNGAFTMWTQGKLFDVDAYYQWVNPILAAPHWAVVPDVIGGGGEDNDRLLKTWPFSRFLAGVVWHMDESLDRLAHLAQEWPRVCFGSTDKFGTNTKACKNRLDEAFGELYKIGALGYTWIHGLRMMCMSGSKYPFASVDSSDLARNHPRPQNNVVSIANRWDVVQCELPLEWCK